MAIVKKTMPWSCLCREYIDQSMYIDGQFTEVHGWLPYILVPRISMLTSRTYILR